MEFKKDKENVLVERIVVMEVPEKEFRKYNSVNEIISNSKSFVPKIIEEYKSNEIKEKLDENYLDSLTHFCFPNGVKITNESKNYSYSLHSFIITTVKFKRRHCTCLTFNECYEVKNSKFVASKVICLVSKNALYELHKEFLMNIISITINFKMYKSLFKEKLDSVYFKEKNDSQTDVKEYYAIDFYFAFLLNCLKFKKGVKSYNFPYLNNNNSKSYYYNFQQKNVNDFIYPNIDITIILDKINVEDIVTIFCGLLMEYKIVFLFDKIDEINRIIWSFVHLLYPFKWRAHIISFINKEMTEYLEAPMPILMGCHLSFENIVKEKINRESISDETLIYNLSTKTFMFKGNGIGGFNQTLEIEFKSNLYSLIGEKLKLSTNELKNSKLDKIFNSKTPKTINTTYYITVKMMQIFFLVICDLMKNFRVGLNQELVERLRKQGKNIRISDVFDSKKFIQEREIEKDKRFTIFLEYFTKTQLLNEFLDHYIKRKNEKIANLILKYSSLILSKDSESKQALKEMNKEFVKNKVIDLHYFHYISIEKAIKLYIEKNGSLAKKNFNENLIWNPLDKEKISRFTIHFEKFYMFETDDKVKDDPSRKTFNELLKFRDQTLSEFNEDEGDIIMKNPIDSQETKMISYLENYYSNSNVRKVHHSAKTKLNEANKNKSTDILSSLDMSKGQTNNSFSLKSNIPERKIIYPYQKSDKIINFDQNMEKFVFNNLEDNSIENHSYIMKIKEPSTHQGSTNNSLTNINNSIINMMKDNLTTRNNLSSKNLFKDIKIPGNNSTTISLNQQNKTKNPSLDFDSKTSNNINPSKLKDLFIKNHIEPHSNFGTGKQTIYYNFGNFKLLSNQKNQSEINLNTLVTSLNNITPAKTDICVQKLSGDDDNESLLEID